MRNLKNLLLFGFITIGILLVAIFYRPSNNLNNQATAGALLPGFMEKIDKIYTIKIMHAGEMVTLQRQQDHWAVAEKANYPAQENQIRELLLALAYAKRVEPKTSNPENYATLGLTDPEKTGSEASQVDILDKTGKPIVQLTLGKRSPAAGNMPSSDFYALLQGDPQTWLVAGQRPAIGAAGAWLKRTLIKLARDRIVKLTLTHSDGETLSITQQNIKQDEQRWLLAGLQADEVIKNDYLLDDIPARFTSMQMEDVQPVDQLKWPETPDLRIDALTKNGLLIHLTAAKIDDQTWIKLQAEVSSEVAANTNATSTADTAAKDKKPAGKTPQQEAADLNASWHGWVYTLADWAFSALNKHRADLVKPATDDNEAATDTLPSPSEPEFGNKIPITAGSTDPLLEDILTPKVVPSDEAMPVTNSEDTAIEQEDTVIEQGDTQP